jgi:hypothetical protein
MKHVTRCKATHRPMYLDMRDNPGCRRGRVGIS